MPYNLKGYAKIRLEKLDETVLRQLCKERSIQVKASEGVNECVSKLLAWKEHAPAESEAPDVSDAPDAPPKKEPDKKTSPDPKKKTDFIKKSKETPSPESKARGGNINVVALDNSRRLAQVLQPSLADAVINERRINGDYDDFDDLQQRVHGLGPEKIATLKGAGFKVEKRAAAAAAGDADEAAAVVGDIRMNVSGMGEQVWRHRNDVDLYTLLAQPVVVQQGAEVDHVWECQMINDANEAATGEGGPASRTRAVQGVVKGLFNGAENLNVTTHAVNQSKKGPFSRWRHQRAKAGSATIDDIVRETEAGKGLVDDGHWERITKAVVSVWDELEQRKEEIRAARAREHAEAVLKQMHLMMEGMALT